MSPNLVGGRSWVVCRRPRTPESARDRDRDRCPARPVPGRPARSRRPSYTGGPVRSPRKGPLPPRRLAGQGRHWNSGSCGAGAGSRPGWGRGRGDGAPARRWARPLSRPRLWPRPFGRGRRSAAGEGPWRALPAATSGLGPVLRRPPAGDVLRRPGPARRPRVVSAAVERAAEPRVAGPRRRLRRRRAGEGAGPGLRR